MPAQHRNSEERPFILIKACVFTS